MTSRSFTFVAIRRGTAVNRSTSSSVPWTPRSFHVSRVTNPRLIRHAPAVDDPAATRLADGDARSRRSPSSTHAGTPASGNAIGVTTRMSKQYAQDARERELDGVGGGPEFRVKIASRQAPGTQRQ
jgi:hypothetical protein